MSRSASGSAFVFERVVRVPPTAPGTTSVRVHKTLRCDAPAIGSRLLTERVWGPSLRGYNRRPWERHPIHRPRRRAPCWRPCSLEPSVNLHVRVAVKRYDAMYREAQRSRMTLADWMRWRLRVDPPRGQ